MANSEYVVLRDDGDEPVIQEYRKDGWPLCPRCGDDELYSHRMLFWFGEGERPTLEQCFEGGFACYFCYWDGQIAPMPKLEE